MVFVGACDEFADLVRSRAERAGVADRVVFTGFVDDDELTALYAGASLFVFPALSEGFGFPGLEAMAHGVPVAAARASCLPETYGDAAAWFEPVELQPTSEVEDEAGFMLFDTVLAFDHVRHRILIIANARITGDEDLEALYQFACARIGYSRPFTSMRSNASVSRPVRSTRPALSTPEAPTHF